MNIHATSNSVCKCFEILRIAISAFGIFISELSYATYPTILLHHLTAWVVIPIFGLTSIQSFFFGKNSAQQYQRQNEFGYQQQSAANNFSIAITAIIVLFNNWGIYADATILIAALIFLTLSAAIHTYEAIKLKRNMSSHIARPILTIALLIICIPALLQVI